MVEKGQAMLPRQKHSDRKIDRKFRFKGAIQHEWWTSRKLNIILAYIFVLLNRQIDNLPFTQIQFHNTQRKTLSH